MSPLSLGRGKLCGVSPALFLAKPLGVPDVAKKNRAAKAPVEHEGRLPAAERTGDEVLDVRVTWHGTPEARPIRLCLRRGGTPVALSRSDATKVANMLLEFRAANR